MREVVKFTNNEGKKAVILHRISKTPNTPHGFSAFWERSVFL